MGPAWLGAAPRRVRCGADPSLLARRVRRGETPPGQPGPRPLQRSRRGPGGRVRRRTVQLTAGRAPRGERESCCRRRARAVARRKCRDERRTVAGCTAAGCGGTGLMRAVGNRPRLGAGPTSWALPRWNSTQANRQPTCLLDTVPLEQRTMALRCQELAGSPRSAQEVGGIGGNSDTSGEDCRTPSCEDSVETLPPGWRKSRTGWWR